MVVVVRSIKWDLAQLHNYSRDPEPESLEVQEQEKERSLSLRQAHSLA